MNISALCRVVAAMTLMAAGAFGQTAGSPGEGLCAVPSNTAGVMQISWWGKARRAYFLQTNETLNRATWSYTPVLETGGNAVLSYSMPSSSGRMFARLVYYDLPVGADASTEDVDGDGVSNGAEIAQNGPRSDPFLADSDWDGYSDGEEVLAGNNPTNPGSNPNPNPNQPLAGNVNPDANYINGIKVEYSRKGMWANYNRSGSETSATTTYRGYHYLPPNGVMLGQDFQAYTSVPGSNDISTMVTTYEGADFLTTRIPFTGNLTVSASKVDTSSKVPNEVEQEYHYLGRSVVELTKTLSGSAPADVQRTLLGLVTRRYNGVLQSRELGTITLGKLNTIWSPELNSFCKRIAGKDDFTIEAPPDGGAPDSNNSSDAESRNESTDLRLISVEIQEVRFSGPAYHELKSDDGLTTYDAPQWKDANGDGKGVTNKDSGDRGYPVAYTKGSLPSIGAALKITGMITGQSYEMKATSLQGVEIPPTPITIATDGSVVLPPTPASKGFADKIEFHDARDNTAFQLDWHVKVGTSNWAKIGSTRHTVYVTLAAPITTAAGLMRETLFNIGCRNARGLSDATQAVDAIYVEFRDQEVFKVKPSSGELKSSKMKYWGTAGLTPAGTHELLLAENGTCQSWARFFTDVLRAQGITGVTVQEIVPGLQKTQTEMEDQHLVDFPTQNRPIVGEALSRVAVKNCVGGPPGGRTDGWFTPITTPTGIAGQGMATPAIKIFNAHAVVQYLGRIYDPSYGVPYIPSGPNAVQTWENNSVEYYVIQMTGTSGTMSNWWVSPDDRNAQDCTMTNSNY